MSDAHKVSAYDDRFACGYCGQVFVVPSLARDCERKHEAAS